MKKPRGPTSHRGTNNSGASGKQATTTGKGRGSAKKSDLPPNKNIQKRPDEVYGDTEIPERKPGT